MKHNFYQNFMLMILWFFLLIEVIVLPGFMAYFGNGWRAFFLWALVLVTMAWLWVTAYDTGVAYGWVR